MHYLIYIPNVKGVGDKVLEAAGLSALKDSGAEFSEHYEGTPDGSHGTLVSWSPYSEEKLNPPKKVNAENWVWRPCPKTPNVEEGQFWLGTNKYLPPLPLDLLRRGEQELDGYEVQLGDGQAWRIVPASAVFREYRAEGKELKWKPEERNEQYTRNASIIAREIFAKLDLLDCPNVAKADIASYSDQPVTFILSGSFDHCCLALSVKYRLTPEICDMLNLVNRKEIQAEIVKASIDLPDIFETREQKKTNDSSTKNTTSESPVVIHVG